MGRRRKDFTQKQQVSVTTKIDADIYKRLLFVVEKKDLTISQIARIAVKEYVDRFERSRKIKVAA